LAIVSLISITGYIFYKIYKLSNTDTTSNVSNTERLKILLQDNSVDKINSCIDQFIENAANMYTLLKLSQDPNHYITEDMQKEMSSYILGSVKKNMTEDILSLISMIYVINSPEDIDDYLNIRIKLYILSFMVNYNQLQTDEGRI
jgi:hypothetical protein